MRLIYLLVERTIWEQEPGAPFTTASLTTEGFIHCAFDRQVVRSANKFHAQADDLLALVIDIDRLTSPVKEEMAGNGDLFPHLYGPLNREAVVRIEPLHRGEDGRWQFTPSPEA